MINPVVRGWIEYYGAFRKSALQGIMRQIELALVKFVMRKFKRFHRQWLKAYRFLQAIKKRDPALFEHWKMWMKPATQQ